MTRWRHAAAALAFAAGAIIPAALAAADARSGATTSASGAGRDALRNPAPAPSPALESWRRIDAQPGGAGGWYFSHATVLRTTGQIWHAWGGKTYLYDAKANVWQPIAGSIGSRENFGSDDDPTNGVVWVGPGAPVMPGQDGLLRYDLTSGSYVLTGPVNGADAVYAWHNDTLYTFGGYNPAPAAQALRSKTTTPDGPWQLRNPAGDAPQLTEETARLTILRGGVNSRTGELWVVGDGQELYVWEPMENRWYRIPTTGPKPPAHSVFTLDESRNAIVGWAGYDQTVDPGTTVLAQTSILDLGTHVWRVGPVGIRGPALAVMVKYIPLYDRVKHRVLLLVSRTDHTEVWEFGDGSLQAR